MITVPPLSYQLALWAVRSRSCSPGGAFIEVRLSVSSDFHSKIVIKLHLDTEGRTFLACFDCCNQFSVFAFWPQAVDARVLQPDFQTYSFSYFPPDIFLSAPVSFMQLRRTTNIRLKHFQPEQICVRLNLQLVQQICFCSSVFPLTSFTQPLNILLCCEM